LAKQTKPQPRKSVKARKQDDDFVSVARRLGADEDKGRFEAMLGKIAKATRDKSDSGWVKTQIKIGAEAERPAKKGKTAKR
jgi:hypothetical protein